jgi:chromate transporter
MTLPQFIDGVALSGLHPAPLIICSTFVGYVGLGLAVPYSSRRGTFAPAFGFTLLGHAHCERLVWVPRVRWLLDCVMAAACGWAFV